MDRRVENYGRRTALAPNTVGRLLRWRNGGALFFCSFFCGGGGGGVNLREVMGEGGGATVTPGLPRQRRRLVPRLHSKGEQSSMSMSGKSRSAICSSARGSAGRWRYAPSFHDAPSRKVVRNTPLPGAARYQYGRDRSSGRAPFPGTQLNANQNRQSEPK